MRDEVGELEESLFGHGVWLFTSVFSQIVTLRGVQGAIRPQV